MRRLIGSGLLLLVMAGTGVRAQEARIGIRAGPTFGFLNDSAVPFVSAAGDATANTNVRLDVHVGAYVILPVHDRVSVQPELLFVQKGGHFSRSQLQRYASERYRLSYVQGQMLGRYALWRSSPLSVHAVAGGTVAHATGGVVRRDVRARELDFTERIPLLEANLIRRWDVGMLVGMGVGYSVGDDGRVSLEVRYGPSFRSVFSTTRRSLTAQQIGLRDPPPLTRTPPDLRHDVITASLSYTVSIK